MSPSMGLDTPRTDATDVTFTSDPDLDFSMERSFMLPSREKQDFMKRNSVKPKDSYLKTPGARQPLIDRRNAPAGPSHKEFTPLLRSVVKSNLLRRQSKDTGLPRTPAILKPGYRSVDPSPTLPAESSAMYGGDTASSYGLGDPEATPMPQVIASSATSTPLASLPKSDEGAVLADGKNVMTLREQENIINKIEKENFGLKLKIHYLEESLRKSGPGVSEAALKENTNLKVDKVTLQKELHQHRKALASAEHNLEVYRKQLAEVQQKTLRKHADIDQREEIDRLQQALHEAQAEVRSLNEKLKASDSHHDDTEGLKGEINDLKADIREKDRLLEEKDEDLNDLRDEVNHANNKAMELELELKNSQEHVRDLEEDASKSEDQKRSLQNARKDITASNEKVQQLEGRVLQAMAEVKAATEEAQAEANRRQQAEADLEELREEIANKSFTTRGLSRQLEEKSNKLRDKLDDLQEEHDALRSDHNTTMQENEMLRNKIHELEQDLENQKEQHHDGLDGIRGERDALARERLTLTSQLAALRDDLLRKTEEKTLLQTRHDALTSESKDLQNELSRTRLVISELEDSLAREKQRTQQNDKLHRDESFAELKMLRNELREVKDALEDQQDTLARERKCWEAERRKLETSLHKSEEDISRLKRTIKLREATEGNLSAREAELKEALELEKERYMKEETILNNRMKELRTQLSTGREDANRSKVEVEAMRDELRQKQREIEAWEEKAQGLEDEIVLLHNNLDDEEQTKEELLAARHEVTVLKQKLQSAIEERDLQKEMLRSFDDTRAQLEAYESETNMLKEQIADYRHQEDLKQKDKLGAEKTMADLRAEVLRLQNRLRDAHARNEKPSMIQERKDLHEQLKSAKVEMEELQIQLSQRELQVESLQLREKDLRMQVRELRNERSVQAQKAIRATSEVDILQRRYETALSKAARLERSWEDECKALQRAGYESTKQHLGEIKGLSKQIIYLRKKCEREERFRADLSFVKKFFLMQVEMYSACNHADLQMIEEMGITPDRSIREKRPSLKSVAFVIIANIRMKKRKEEWAQSVKIKEKLLATLDQTRKRARRKAGT